MIKRILCLTVMGLSAAWIQPFAHTQENSSPNKKEIAETLTASEEKILGDQPKGSPAPGEVPENPGSSQPASPEAQSQENLSPPEKKPESKEAEPAETNLPPKQEAPSSPQPPEIKTPEVQPAAMEIKPQKIEVVLPLNELVSFYDEESSSIKKLIQRWTDHFKSYADRQLDLKIKMTALKKEIDEKKKSLKKNKKEIGGLTKQLNLFLKEEKDIEREVKKEYVKFSSEVKEIGKTAPGAVKTKFQEVYDKITDSYKK